MRKVIIGLLLGTVLLAHTGCFEVVVEERGAGQSYVSSGWSYDSPETWSVPDVDYDYREVEWVEETWVEEWYWFDDEEWYYDEWYYDDWYEAWYYDASYYDAWYNNWYYWF